MRSDPGSARPVREAQAELSVSSVLGAQTAGGRPSRAVRTHDQEIGLHLAEHATLDSLDVHFHAMLSNPTLGEAFRRMIRYQPAKGASLDIPLTQEAEGAAPSAGYVVVFGALRAPSQPSPALTP